MPLTTIKSSNIKDAEVKNVDISPTAAIDGSKVTGLDTTQLETNAFNIGVLGFKMAVNEGLTLFNLVDGCLLYTSPSPRDLDLSRMPSSA